MEIVLVGHDFATYFEKTTPAIQRCCSYGRDKIDARRSLLVAEDGGKLDAAATAQRVASNLSGLAMWGDRAGPT